ncbi:MAG TPA: transglycosylase domain-containing protein [Acidimicrobiales bacterium]|nr:transglycosylase domain-containing protein [Acidimicrobiales bacterium]
MRKFLTLLLVVALSGAGLAVSALALAPQARNIVSATRVEDPRFRLRPLDERSIVYAGDGTVLASLHREQNREVVPLSEIPDPVIQTILAVEDENFYDHGPVDLRSTVRALFENVSAGDVEQGGSTITQQLVKISLLSPEQSLNRKMREAVLAVQLERDLTKDQILRRYLNSVYFGGGAYGVQAAAELYFDKDVGELGWGEAAMLASLIQNPVGYDPVRRPEQAQERRRVALQRLVETGHLTQEEADFYDVAPLPTARNQVLPQPNDYFIEEVKQSLLDNPNLGATEEERYNAVFRGGLRIYTTFSPTAQYYALLARNSRMPDTANRFTAALVSVEAGTGAVRAMVGGPGFENYKYNLATQGLRQPGSSFKMIVLMAALENGIIPDDNLDGGGPCSFANPGGAPDPYVATNFGGSRGGRGSITSLTTSSSNCGYLRLGQIVGLDKVVETARRLGITTPLNPAAMSMPIGAFEVHPIEMAAMAAAIANEGRYNEPYFIERIEDRRGNVIEQHVPENRQVVSAQSACLESQILEANVRGGTGTAAQLPNGRPAAGKTGTAQNFGDAWFVGYTPQLATAVWMGNAEARVPMTSVGGRSVTGGSYPAQIWHDFMAAAHTLAPIEPFPTCEPTRPGRAIDRIPDFRDLAGGGSGQEVPVDDGSTTPQSVPAQTCPPGFIPAAAGCYQPVPTTAPDPVVVTVPP